MNRIAYAVLPATAVALAAAVLPSTASADPAPAKKDHFAVIGDVPYGADQIARFPAWIGEINAATTEFTVHVGDIKNGSTVCSDEYITGIRTVFDTVENPLIFTPGDNEWTDCHRANNGAYNPLERLAFIQETFYPTPGQTLGETTRKVEADTAAGYPENVQWREDRVSMAAVHVVGSNDGTLPWAGLGLTEPTPEQVAEQSARMDSALRTVRGAFADATRRQDRAVAIFLQADMFDPTYEATFSDVSAFKPLVQLLIDQSNAFHGETYLFNGDSHAYNEDQPLVEGSKWLSLYGVDGSSELRRVTVDGSNNNTDWLDVTVGRDKDEPVLTWKRVPYVH
ncbi:hypothetical protein [Knoellia subterranea]|uniref:Calcineurin-like phosphoesterase domain-containing protein n=1 Tax=Knoellia subterranea KCTC 19937 TaxID=1385521 RepID=A0A0A0JL39_9MICO|nr:hypothetical protein [Knoellia subterranea]KGN38140.1 hypothetical protein N803_10265 [Knoellia subterranea KCTC 19937]